MRIFKQNHNILFFNNKCNGSINIPIPGIAFQISYEKKFVPNHDVYWFISPGGGKGTYKQLSQEWMAFP
jgi:hypothetical protein